MGSVTLAPEGRVLAVGATLQLSANVTSAGGAPVTGRTVAWLSEDTVIVVVSGAGLLTARAPGQATVSATVSGSVQLVR